MTTAILEGFRRRRKRAFALRDAGATYTEIGAALGVTRQCALSIIQSGVQTPAERKRARRRGLVAKMHAEGLGVEVIAQTLDVVPQTIYSDIKWLRSKP